ncbi:capsid protein VPI [Xanthomonas oryzae pv. oryzae KACC 10331]|uniref:Capsid protein VPI n=1 Tax=Xanthomonas oryzae pv. oryzae (strain KACC10331 / KXO85) TaxID=291331 RepID=Q5GU05_XANOR|nr:capsid protein VPI [Xanthomonas oryzae pv. oryzae KACC 10331]
MAAVRNERAHADRTTGARRSDQHHLRHRGLAHIAQLHQRAGEQTQRFQARRERGVGIERGAVFVTADADIAGAQHHAWHAVVDQRDLQAVERVYRLPAGQQCTARGAGDIGKCQRGRRRRTVHAIDPGIALITHLAIGCLHGGGSQGAGVAHENAHFGLANACGQQAALQRERGHAGQHVAAVLRIADLRLFHCDLQEQIVHVGIGTCGARHHGGFRCQRIGATHAVDLAHIRRAVGAQQKRIARGGVGRQLVGQKKAALGGAAAHPHRAHALRHNAGPWRPGVRALHRYPGPVRRLPGARACAACVPRAPALRPAHRRRWHAAPRTRHRRRPPPHHRAGSFARRTPRAR